MPLYEHVFLVRQDVSNTQVETMTKEYTEILEANGGKVAAQEYWGIKPLAYKIKKNRKAHYSMLNIDAPHAAVAEMERQMGISTDVLRFLTLKVDEHEASPSVMMRKDDRRDGPRGGRGGDRDRGGRGGDRGSFRGGGDRDRGGDRGGSTFRPRPDAGPAPTPSSDSEA